MKAVVLAALLCGALVSGLLARQATLQVLHAPIATFLRPSVAAPCTPSVRARGVARWQSGQGAIDGLGTLLVEVCRPGVLTLNVRGLALDGVPVRLVVASSQAVLLERDVRGAASIRLAVSQAGPLTLAAPNAEDRLEDRNLYIDHFRFSPTFPPCFQAPPTLAPTSAGIIEHDHTVLYAQGSLIFIPCGPGRLSFVLGGSTVQGTGPDATVWLGDQIRRRGPAHTLRKVELEVARNVPVRIDFTNDAALLAGRRALEIQRLSVDR